MHSTTHSRVLELKAHSCFVFQFLDAKIHLENLTFSPLMAKGLVLV